MCGDIMITKNKTKNSSVLVVSIMCAVIMTIMWQSINDSSDTYALSTSQSHEVAHDQFVDSKNQNVYKILDNINLLLDKQKKFIDEYVMWNLVSPLNSQSLLLTGGTWWSFSSEKKLDNIINDSPSYKSFDELKKALNEKKCDYTLPIDNTDQSIQPYIKWWLDHCLITVSAAGKVYPNDILTNEMMRIIANRAWLVVNMDYASNKPVSKDQFFSFFYALQQHHKLGDLPALPISNPLKRWEYLRFIYTVFDGVNMTTLPSTWTILTWFFQWSDTDPSVGITIKEFKEMLITEWISTEITAYDDNVMVTPEIMKEIISNSNNKWLWLSKADSSIGIDKELLKETLSRVMEKI